MNEKEILVDKLIKMGFLYDCIPKKPGELIRRLSEKEREIVKTLTSKDFYHRMA